MKTGTHYVLVARSKLKSEFSILFMHSTLSDCMCYMYVKCGILLFWRTILLCFEVCVALLQVRLMPEQREVSFSLLIVG